LNVPEINNYSPTVETWTDLRQRFSSIEQAWQKQQNEDLNLKQKIKFLLSFPMVGLGGFYLALPVTKS